ncbi:4391_t:CDS:10, partial [Acaulospora morrowiae]
SVTDIEYYYEENDDRDTMTEEQKVQMREGKRKVRAIIGQQENITDKEIEDTLWDYYFDTEETIVHLLEKHQAQKRRREAASNKDSRADHNDHSLNDGFLRPISIGADVKVHDSSLNKNVATSTGYMNANCITQKDIWYGHKVWWSNFVNVISEETTIVRLNTSNIHSGGLLGGADSEEQNSSQPGFSNLRRKLASDGPSSEENLLNTKLSLSANIGIQDSGKSLLSLARSSVRTTSRRPLTSFSADAMKKQESKKTEKSPLSSTYTSQSQSSSLLTLAQKSLSQSTSRVPLSSLALSSRGKSITSSQTTSSKKDQENLFQSQVQAFNNSLIAPPSIFAIELFADLQPTCLFSNNLSFELYSADLNEKIFSFKEPSPGALKGTLSASQKSLRKDVTDEIIEDKEDLGLRIDMDALQLVDPIESSKVSSEVTTTVANKESSAPRLQPNNLPRASKANSNKSTKRIDIVTEYKKRTAEKLPLNLVVIGHVDAGKSTLMGHLLYLLGEVNEKTMKGYERESSRIGKSSFSYAWVLDETDEERRRGITMDIAITKFETENRRFTLLDAPGHKDFIPNMISGAAQADVAILVVDATTGEFEAGFEANGQTKEHALLVRSLGVQQLVVAINKLDVVGWSRARYDEIVTKLSNFLSSTNFKKDKVFYVPCSGLTGENLVERSPNTLDWYDGKTLVQQIDLFEPPVRLLEKPFRLSVSDFFKGGMGNSSGVMVAGRIEGGSIQVGDEIMVVPGYERSVVK